MAAVTLSPESEAIAEAALATGRYDDKAAVVAAALRLLREQERQRKAFIASLEAAEKEGDEQGWIEIEELEAILDADEASFRAGETARRVAS
jgi:putative addiction module CopG family antidote